jgi:hypothetical protein
MYTSPTFNSFTFSAMVTPGETDEDSELNGNIVAAHSTLGLLMKSPSFRVMTVPTLPGMIRKNGVSLPAIRLAIS